MFEEFHPASETKIIRDAQRVPRSLRHEPYIVSTAASPQLAAQQYLARFRDLLEVNSEELRNLGLSPERELTDAGIEYRFFSEKSHFNMTTVSYHQTALGLPVWEAGLAVYMKRAPFRVVGMRTTRHPDLKVAKPSAKALARSKKLSAATIANALGILRKRTTFRPKSLRVQRQRRMIYRYQDTKRVILPDLGVRDDGRPVSALSMLPLPSLDRSIVNNGHYIVTAAYFQLDSRQFGNIHWVVLLEAETLSVLHVRAFADDVCGLVYQADPKTAGGVSAPSPTADNGLLNPFRSSVMLEGLDAPVNGQQSLSGEIITVDDFEPPDADPPTEATGANFDYQVRTNCFAAVNAYYHCDRFFRLLEDLGFSRSGYFAGTTFPIPVDHRGQPKPEKHGIEVNARCEGNGQKGIHNVKFALAETANLAEPIGIACDWRVTLHEIGGHGTLHSHINTGKFNFAHSAGDSFAAILSDPDTKITGLDRGLTFPWILDRRHDRDVAAGWAWGGTKDLGVPGDGAPQDPNGYQSEQILSSTHFRLYQSIGGDSLEPEMRRFAARFATYLILHAIGQLNEDHPPEHAADFAFELMCADDDDWTTKGHAGGAYSKVIRWAFERQGLYQIAGPATSVTAPGAPPQIDVYIDDGRKGEYQYQANYWNCQAIWNRLANDGGTAHQDPVVGTTNFAFVKIKNRGRVAATHVKVKAFHCNPSAGLVYPDDWQPMSTAELPAPDVPANPSAEIIVGPFEWEPTQVGHECMFMVVSAPGDRSNVEKLSPGVSIPEWRLVPHDNNIGQRNVSPVAATSPRRLQATFEGRRIYVKNPHDERARMVVKATLPPVLAELDWQIEYASPGGSAFSLEARTGRDVVLKLKAGRNFSIEDLKRAGDRAIHVQVYADGILVGGTSYTLDATNRSE